MKFDEFTVGQTFKTKSFKLTKADIMQFAEKYDPQYMHIDEEKAKQGRFKGIIASGMQTMSIAFKLWVEEGIYGEDVVAGTGMNNVKFIKPVYPEDELYSIVEVTDKQEKSAEAGIVTVILSTYNDKEKKVFTGELSALIKR